MSVWYCIPSKRPAEQAGPVLRNWRERGYKVALWCDTADELIAKHSDTGLAPDAGYPYPGYASAVNKLIRAVLAVEPDAEWFVTGGDDTYPDSNHTAEEIARECAEHFAEVNLARYKADTFAQAMCLAYDPDVWKLFGVMQPTGDRYGSNERHLGQPGSAYVDRVASSPWMGREFCRRMYGGRGPLFDGYFHMGEDEELQAVAMKLGVFWQRPDLTHYHEHWARARGDERDRPAFLDRAASPEEWRKYKALFAERQAAGFPGHEPKG